MELLGLLEQSDLNTKYTTNNHNNPNKPISLLLVVTHWQRALDRIPKKPTIMVLPQKHLKTLYIITRFLSRKK